MRKVLFNAIAIVMAFVLFGGSNASAAVTWPRYVGNNKFEMPAKGTAVGGIADVNPLGLTGSFVVSTGLLPDGQSTFEEGKIYSFKGIVLSASDTDDNIAKIISNLGGNEPAPVNPEGYVVVPLEILPTETTLADVASTGVTGTAYNVTGNGLKSVGHFTAHSGDKYLVVTDEDQSYVNYVDVTASALSGTENLWSGTDGSEVNQKAFTQNNWALLKVSESDFDKVNVTINSFTGTLTDDCNLTFEATEVNEGSEVASQTPNIYIPLNFYKTDHVNWSGLENELIETVTDSKGKTHNYFLMPPKRAELVQIHWLVLASDSNFYLPKDKSYNPYGWTSGLKPNWDYNEVDVAGSLTANRGYNITAIVKSNQVAHPGSASRKASASETVIEPYTDAWVTTWYTIYPINVKSEDEIITAVTDVDAPSQVVSVTYCDLAGRTSAQPFEGVNVVVTRYANGSTATAKVVR